MSIWPNKLVCILIITDYQITNNLKHIFRAHFVRLNRWLAVSVNYKRNHSVGMLCTFISSTANALVRTCARTYKLRIWFGRVLSFKTCPRSTISHTTKICVTLTIARNNKNKNKYDFKWRTLFIWNSPLRAELCPRCLFHFHFHFINCELQFKCISSDE